MAKKKITIEEAQGRLDRIERDFTIIEWNGTGMACKIVCNKCGLISTVRRGSLVYTPDSFYFTWGKCWGCEDSSIIQHRNMSGRKLLENIEKEMGIG